jgi:O-antigen/teichoic acid export membrane protein
MFVRAVSFAMTVVVARLLGSEIFGRFGIINGTVSTFAVVGTLGMGVASTKLVAQNRTQDPARAGRFMTTSIIGALITGGLAGLALFFSAPWVASFVLGDATLTMALRLSAFSLFFIAWSSAQSGGFGGVEAFAESARITIVVTAVSSVLSFVGVWRWGFIGAVAAMPAAGAIQCLVQEVMLRRVLARRGIPYSFRRPLAEARTVLAIGFPAMLSAGVYLPASWLGSVILVRYAGYKEMAVFTIGDQWFNFVLMLPMVIGSVLLPVMTNVFSSSDADASRSLMRRTFATNLVFSAIPLVAVAPFGFIVLRLYGPSYPAHWLVFALMVTAACVVSMLSPVGHALTATGRMWLGSAMNLGWSISYLSLAYLLVAVLAKGALGLAMARLLAYGLHAVWALVYLRAVLKHGSNGLAIRL